MSTVDELRQQLKYELMKCKMPVLILIGWKEYGEIYKFFGYSPDPPKIRRLYNIDVMMMGEESCLQILTEEDINGSQPETS